MNEDKNNQNENGFEAYIENEFQEEVPSNESEELNGQKNNMLGYFGYAFVFTMILIVFGITSTYAYFTLQISSESSSTTAITAKTECFDVTLIAGDGEVSAGNSSTLTLGDYNYPITDVFAVGDGDKQAAHITPMTIKVTNNCVASDTNKTAIPYKLFLSTFTKDNASAVQTKDIIPDSKMKIRVMRQLNGAAETELKAPVLISLLPQSDAATSGNTNLGDILNKAISDQGTTAGLTLSKNYVIDGDQTIAPGATNTYKIYAWVDYYEGCAKENATTDGCNGSTAGKDFKAIVSAIIN